MIKACFKKPTLINVNLNPLLLRSDGLKDLVTEVKKGSSEAVKRGRSWLFRVINFHTTEYIL